MSGSSLLFFVDCNLTELVQGHRGVMSTPRLASTRVPLALYFLPLDASTHCPTSFVLQIQGASIYPRSRVFPDQAARSWKGLGHRVASRQCLAIGGTGQALSACG
jgi:hypothetical protein